MTLVVDASVAVKWVVAEAGHEQAVEQAAGRRLVAPEFALVETASILWKKVRLKTLSDEQALGGFSFIRNAYVHLYPTQALIDRSLAIALTFDHPIYDCLYCACSELEGAELLTADRRLSQLCTRLGTFPVQFIGEAAI